MGSTEDVDPRLVDVVLALAMALAVAVVIAADFGEPGRADPIAYLFATGFGALVLLRRRLVRTMLVLTVLGIFAYYALDLPIIGMALPAVAALYSAAELGRTGWAAGAGVVLIGVSAFFRIIEDQPVSYLYGWELLTNVALTAAAVALGVAVRQTRAARRHADRVAVLMATEQERLATQRIQAERVRIARDLHDSVGHNLSVISLHAGVASEAIGDDDDAAARALEHVREATGATLGELRATVRLLRTPGMEEPPRAAAGLAGIEDLVAAARRAGVEVSLDMDPAPAVDGAVTAAAHRIVQESLTNILRHSGARSARVRLHLDGDELRVLVTDDGAGSGTGPSRQGPAGRAEEPRRDEKRGDAGQGDAARRGENRRGENRADATRHDEDTGRAADGSTEAGQGIAGMRERAALLGGRLTAGDRPEGGFAVEASLPVRLDAGHGLAGPSGGKATT